MSDYVAISFENLTSLQKEILIAQLSEIGFEGFEEGTNWLSAFIKKDEFNEDDLDGIIDDPAIVFNKKLILHQNWNTEWEKNFEPVRVDDFVFVRATFHRPAEDVQHEIIITPKMSFGTGHHATTFMMMQMMRNINFTNKRVLDFGTGTGILSVLAEKLGADYILAIDNDEWSIANATENFEINRCARIRLLRADRIAGSEQFELILANINRSVLLANMPELGQHLAPGGVVLMSGLLKDDEAEIETAALNAGLIISSRIEAKGWIALKLIFRPA